MNLTPAQKVIALDMHRFRVLCCGRRFGKTTLAIDQMKARAAIANSRVVYIAPTYQQARDIAWSQLKKDCEGASKSINEARLEITLVNGSLIQLKGWEAIETLRGQAFHLIVIDEVAMMRDFMHQWQEVVLPTLTDFRGEVLLISTPRGFNHFYDLFNLQEKDTDWKSFHYTSYDNPHLPMEEIMKVRNSPAMTPERFSQEYLADFTKTEGLVYKDFNRAKHLFGQDTEQYVETLVGIDFGFTNPAAVITVKRDRADGLWITSEFYERGKTDSEVADYVSSLSANRVFPDPESPAAIVELRRRGVNLRDVVKGKDSIKNGIDRVREYLRAGKLHIHVSCVNTIMELETYSYADKKDMHAEQENPIDDNNHALDAIRYVVMMIGKSQSNASFHDPHFGQLRPQFTQNLPRLGAGPKNYATTYGGKHAILMPTAQNATPKKLEW